MHYSSGATRRRVTRALRSPGGCGVSGSAGASGLPGPTDPRPPRDASPRPAPNAAPSGARAREHVAPGIVRAEVDARHGDADGEQEGRPRSREGSDARAFDVGEQAAAGTTRGPPGERLRDRERACRVAAREGAIRGEGEREARLEVKREPASRSRATATFSSHTTSAVTPERARERTLPRRACGGRGRAGS